MATVAVTMGLGATCRTVPAARPKAPAAQTPSAATPIPIPPPVIRVGLLPDVLRSSIGADSGLVVRGVAADGKQSDRQVARATFMGAGEAIRLVETGEQPAEQVAQLLPLVAGESGPQGHRT